MTTRKSRLLIIEDEPAIREGLLDVFVYHGYAVDSAQDGPAGLRLAREQRPDLVLLDIMLPGLDGFAVCDRLRAEDPELPIIMLTARNTDEDIIHGLRLGADDYVTKPFSITQLVLRVQAVLRRTQAPTESPAELRIGTGIVVDVGTLSARVDRETVHLTRREIDTLLYLATHTERAVGREELLDKVWGYANTSELETRTVDIHIAKLRRKLEADPKQPRFLVTVRGGGYRLLDCRAS